MLKLTHVTKKYSDVENEPIIALDDVSLTLPDEGLVVINGASGCGKTTLLNLLGGLDKPTSGEIYSDTVRIDDKSEKWWDEYRGKNLGFIYQDFNLLEKMTVKDNIKLPLTLLQFDECTKEKKIEEIINELGLKEYADKKAGKLSGGQKQRVAIARALVSGSKIILADEPTGNLDKDNSENVFKLLKRIAKKRLVIVVTHDSALAEIYADRLIQISYGKIECDRIIENNACDKHLTEKDKTFFNESINVNNKQKKISLKECIKFAKEAILQRKKRCIVSIMIFSITMFLILLLCEVIFRNDSVPMVSYLNKNNQILIPLYMEVPDEYLNLVDDEKVINGRNIYELVCQCTDNSRIIRYGGVDSIKYKEEISEQGRNFFVDAENEKYFLYEGTFPKKKNEVAISDILAKKLLLPQKPLGERVYIKGKEYIVTAIVKQLCGKDLSNSYADNGMGDNVFENIMLFSTEVLKDREREQNIYMSGFGVTLFSNLFYQTTVFNSVSAADEAELVAGRMPVNDNEIIISQDLLDGREMTYDEVLGKEYPLNDIYEDKYGCSYWDMINLYDYMGKSMTIVGVAKGTSEYYLLPSLYSKIFEEYFTYFDQSFYMIADDDKIENDIYNILNNNVRVLDQDLKKVYNFIEGVDSVKIGMLLICVIIALLTVLQMISLYSYSIDDNKKTIGILRTMGVNKYDTIKIFIVESALISTVSYFIAIIIGSYITKIINDFISYNVFEFEGFDFLHMRFVILIVTGLISFVLSALSVIIPIRKYSKNKIIQLIK